MNGSGRPVTGMIPIAMPTLMNNWNAKTLTTPAATSMPNVSRDNAAIRNARHSSKANSAEQQDAADEAGLLADDGEDEVRLVLGHERERRLRALEQALAEQLPEPTAICACVTLYAVP